MVTTSREFPAVMAAFELTRVTLCTRHAASLLTVRLSADSLTGTARKPARELLFEPWLRAAVIICTLRSEHAIKKRSLIRGTGEERKARQRYDLAGTRSPHREITLICERH